MNEKKEMSIQLNWLIFSRYENINRKVNLRLFDSHRLKNHLKVVTWNLKNSDGKDYWMEEDFDIVNLNHYQSF